MHVVMTRPTLDRTNVFNIPHEYQDSVMSVSSQVRISLSVWMGYRCFQARVEGTIYDISIMMVKQCKFDITFRRNSFACWGGMFSLGRKKDLSMTSSVFNQNASRRPAFVQITARFYSNGLLGGRGKTPSAPHRGIFDIESACFLTFLLYHGDLRRITYKALGGHTRQLSKMHNIEYSSRFCFLNSVFFALLLFLCLSTFSCCVSLAHSLQIQIVWVNIAGVNHRGRSSYGAPFLCYRGAFPCHAVLTSARICVTEHARCVNIPTQ